SVECKFGICADNETLDLESDGYQYIRSEDPLISALYREWWFFALYDPLVDIGFCIGYSAMDPAKTFGLEASGIAGMLWTSVANNTGQDPTNVLDGYDFEQFSAYKENATVSIGKENFIKVLDQTTYQIIGSSRNGELNWSLTFHQKSYACRQKEEVPQVLELDWIAYMPSAHVFGVIQYNTKLFSINTTAYHDHNYGAWPTNLFNWIWAQFHRVDKEFSLVLGSYHIPVTENEYIGYIFIRWRNQRIEIGTLCGNTFHLKPLEWQIVDGKKYSIHNKIEAWNDQYKINIEYKARVSNDNPGGRGLGLKVFEQISQYEVILYGKHEDNWVILEQNLTGYGFSEWSHVEI
ncbi:unnamed protein product, partial [Rotaria socialis]